MAELIQMTVREFLAATAAKQPAPGGGAAAALGGALAAALAAMVLEYTVGKKAFAVHDTELRAALDHFHKACDLLQELLAEDAAAYESLAAFLKLPEGIRLVHPDYAATVVAAIRAPQTVGGFALNILEQCAALVDKTNRFLLSDLGIAAAFAQATVHAAELNVRINLPLLPNQEEAAELKESMRALSVKADTFYAALHGELLRRL